jgi:hypothetical protein
MAQPGGHVPRYTGPPAPCQRLLRHRERTGPARHSGPRASSAMQHCKIRPSVTYFTESSACAMIGR